MTATAPAPPPTTTSRPRRPARPTLAEGVVLLAALAAGSVLRAMVLRGRLGYVDLDEAAVGLQARHFAAHPQVFFPGQPYGGTLETAIVALVRAVGGDGALALKATPMALHLAACVVVWRVALRVAPGRLGALAAPVLLWCGPAAGTWESTKARGFYGAALVISALVLLVAVRLDEHTTLGDLVALGLLAGIGWWTTPLVLLTVVPAVLWLLARRPERWRFGGVVGAAAVLGAAPWIAWNARNGWASLRQPADFGSDIGHRFSDGLVKVAVLLGLETPWDPDRTLVPAARVVGVALLVGVLAAATWRTRRTAPGFLAAVTAGYLVCYPLSNSAGSVGADPRYLYLLLPALSLAIASALPDPPERLVPVALAGVVLVASLGSWWGVRGLEAVADADPSFLDAPGLDRVASLLEERDVRRVVTDVAGAQLTDATDERIRASSFVAPRFPELERVALVREPTTYVLRRDLFGNEARLERYLRARGIGYQRRDLGVWTVVFVDAWVPPWTAGMVSLGVPVGRPD